MSERKAKLRLLPSVAYGSILSKSCSRRLTCCAAVFPNGELELLSDRRDLEVIINGVGPVWPQAQIKPQLIAGGSVGELIYLVQT